MPHQATKLEELQAKKGELLKLRNQLHRQSSLVGYLKDILIIQFQMEGSAKVFKKVIASSNLLHLRWVGGIFVGKKRGLTISEVASENAQILVFKPKKVGHSSVTSNQGN